MDKLTFINELIVYNQENRAIVEKEFSPLTVDELNIKPAADKWSIAECLSHIVNSGYSYRSRFESIDLTGRGDGEIKYSLLGKLLIKFVAPEAAKKAKHPAVFNPDSGTFPKEIVEDYYEWNDYFINLINSSNALPLSKIKITSPALKILSFNLTDILKIISLHERRHLKQALRVKALFHSSE